MKSLLLLLAFGLAASEKLDRTYLPPPGSKHSGGSPGDLQVPLEYPKETYTTASPSIKAGLNDNRINSPENTQLVPGIQRFPESSYQGPKSIVPVSSVNTPFNFNVPTTTTSYAFSQTTTFPPIEGFETTINPTAQGFSFDGSVRPQPGIVNQPFIIGQNYPQTSSQGRLNFIEPGSQVTQFPGIIPHVSGIPESQATTSGGQTDTGQPNYNQIQNQYPQNILSSTVSPNIITQPGVTSYNQGYTQHLGVQPPRQFIHQGTTPVPFPGYSSNIPEYQNTSFFQKAVPGVLSQQLGQQPIQKIQIQGQRPIFLPPNLQPGKQYVDQYGSIPSTAAPSTSIFQKPGQYQGPQFGIQDTVPTTPVSYNSNIYSTSGVITPDSQSSQPGSQNNLALGQGPYPITGIQGIPKSSFTQSQVPQYGFQQGNIPSTSLPQRTTVSVTNGQSPVTSQGTYSSTNIQQVTDAPASQKINQPFIGQQSPLTGTQLGQVQQQGIQLPVGGQQGYYSTTDVIHRPNYGPELLQQQGQTQSNEQQGFPTSNFGAGQQNQFGNQQNIYPANIAQETPYGNGISGEQLHTPGQQENFRGSPSSLQQGSVQVESKTDNISKITNPTTNIQPGAYLASSQQTQNIQPDVRQNIRPYGQQPFDQSGPNYSQKFTTLIPETVSTQNTPGLTGSSPPGYGQFSIPSITPTSIPYSTTQRNFNPSNSNFQGTMSTAIMQPTPVRPQADVEKNAEILNYHNVHTPEGYSYSFDTSNGIHTDENGTTIDGTRANGSYSYIGDDGKLYKVEYSADENGFRPYGDHIPTPPPVPKAIQRVIEQAEKERAAGISHDGSYDHSRYGPKQYQKQKHRQPQTQKVKDKNNVNNGLNLSDNDTRYTIEDKNKLRTQPGHKSTMKNNYGSLDDFDQNENDNDLNKDSFMPTFGLQSTNAPAQNYNSDSTDDIEANLNLDRNHTAAVLKSDKTKPLIASRRRPENVGIMENQGYNNKPRLRDDDYDLLTEDDFDQISKYKRPSTSDYKGTENRKYLPERQPSISSKYDENNISEERVSNSFGDQQQYPGRRPSKKPQGENRSVTTVKYDKDSYNEEEQTHGERTQLNKPVQGHTKKLQVNVPGTSSEHEEDLEDEQELIYDQESRLGPGKRLFSNSQGHKQPSYTKFEENYYNDNIEGNRQSYGPQGVKRPITFTSKVTEKGDTDKFDSQELREHTPEKGLARRPQFPRKPNVSGSFEDEHTYKINEQNRRLKKPENNSSKNHGVKYPVTGNLDKQYTEDSINIERPKKPTYTRIPVQDTHNIKTGLIRPTPISQEDIENIDYSTASTFKTGKPFYKQDQYPIQEINEKSGYQYNRPQNAFEQVNNKFPSRFSEKVQGDVTKGTALNYDIADTKSTAQPFITPYVSRDDDEGHEDSSEENSLSKKPDLKTFRKGITSSYKNYKTTDDSQEDLDDGNENTTKYLQGRPSKIGSHRRPTYTTSDKPEYNDSNENNEGSFKSSTAQYPAGNKKVNEEQRPDLEEHQRIKPYTTVSSNTQAPTRILRPSTIQPSDFNEGREKEIPYSTNFSPKEMNETEEGYTGGTTPTGLSTLATRRPSRPGSYSGVTEPSIVTTPGSFIIPTAMPTSQSVYNYLDKTSYSGIPNIRPGLSESVFSHLSSKKPPKPGYHPTNSPGSEIAIAGNVSQTEIRPDGYHQSNQVTGPTLQPQGNKYPNAGLIAAKPEFGSRFAGRPGLQNLPSTTYRPNYSVPIYITPTSQISVDAFGRPISGDNTQSRYVTPGQNIPPSEGAVYQDTEVIKTGLPSNIFNAGESRFGVTTSTPGPKPAEFGPSSITTPGYLGPRPTFNKVIGENFSGPKQPQRFDPNTGYYY